MGIKRFLKPPHQTFFLLGPRGTGKTTWLREHFKDAHWVDFLDEGVYQKYLANPSLFADEIRALPKNRWVVVDEIQRLPNLLNEVHREIETSHRFFALCGSSARKLRRSGVNLLAGRALSRAMHPFLANELGNGFSVEEALTHGLLPVVHQAKDKEDTLRSYAQLYLKNEIQAEAIVRNLPGFARFLPVAALMHGQTMNVSNLARESGISRETTTGHLNILEETLLCFKLPAYESKIRVRERRLPKWYWCDPGIVRAMKQSYGPPTAEERGPLFEGLVAQTLRACQDYTHHFDDMFYWSPAETKTTEVDFLLVKGKRKIAVEVKAGNTFNDSWGRGLKAVQDLPGVEKRILVRPHGLPMKLKTGVDVLPFSDFSSFLFSEKLFPTV